MAAETAQQHTTGVTAELYRAVIGPRGQDHYLRHFTKFDADGKTGVSWHWPAYWATLNWLIYRRMWGWVLAYFAALLGAALVIFGVGKLVFDYSDSTGLLLFLVFLTGAFVLPGLYGNAWYYNYCTEKISSALRRHAEVKDARDELAAQASTKKRWFGLATANVAMYALVAGVAAFMLNGTPESIHLAQNATDQPAEADLASLAQPALVPASLVQSDPPPAMPSATPPAAVDATFITSPAKLEALAAKPAESASEATDLKPVQVAAAKTAPATAEQATGEGARAKPERADAARKPKVAKARRHWFVQVGAFAQEANAKSVLAKVEATGLQSSAEPSQTQAGRLTRVRVGPFDTKAEAEKAALRIKALDLPAVLFKE